MVSPNSTEHDGTRLRDVTAAELEFVRAVELHGPNSREAKRARKELESRYRHAGAIEPM